MIRKQIPDTKETFYEKTFSKKEFEKWAAGFLEEMEMMENNGWKNVEVVFSVVPTPYDDEEEIGVWLDGERELTKAEKEELLREKEIEKLAKVKGITFYEASVLKKLTDEGKV